MSNNTKFFSLCAVCFAAILTVGGMKYVSLSNELRSTQVLISREDHHQATVHFLQMFIHDVIQADKEVDFATRLKLENAVQDLHDQRILAQWQKFVASTHEAEAQSNVKNFLGLLVDTIAKE